MNSSGERDLDRLLASLEPRLDAEQYVFVSVASGVAIPSSGAMVTVVEAEGTTLVLSVDALHAARDDGLELPEGPLMAHITLNVHSSLEAVGLTAAVAATLTSAGISCNVVAGYFHDHLFVPSVRADEAIELLRTLSWTSP